MSEKPNRIIAVSRISDEKRPQDIVRALSLVIKQVPDATLEFRGYVSGNTGKKILKLLDELKLKNKVIQRPYTTDKKTS
ncbi:glycosyltransferase [Secundilactobacillus silagei]|uniref:glycosyltransferase n=1 Tax=Secundilactobacillus silagei TaxID=1293415 RepID=UPI0006CF8C34|nr:glycosyltransferase [Secundilactobacillus silagei]